MNFFIRSLTLALALLFTTNTLAATYKYELLDIYSHGGFFPYPDLNLNGVKSATITVKTSQFSPELDIESLKINFTNAAALTAFNFKKINNEYRAIVKDAWIFREVIVKTSNLMIGISDQPLHIEVFVSYMSSFMNPESVEMHGPRLVEINGRLSDITPSTIVDIVSTIASSKTVKLSLRDRLSLSTGFSTAGFIVDVLWMGKGKKSLYFPVPVSPDQFDTIEPIGIVLDDWGMISIKFRQGVGPEQVMPAVPLRPLLDNAYRTF